jgi:hypothetical protein
VEGERPTYVTGSSLHFIIEANDLASHSTQGGTVVHSQAIEILGSASSVLIAVSLAMRSVVKLCAFDMFWSLSEVPT